MSTPVRRWPVLLLAAPAGVAIWTGWVGLGGMTGFGVVTPLPGIADHWRINSAITLPIGVEAYAAYALHAWLTPGTPDRARRFARTSAIGALILGALGQVVYHLLVAAGATVAPWPITVLVSCLPVAVLGMGAALAHLLGEQPGETVADAPEPHPAPVVSAPVSFTPPESVTPPQEHTTPAPRPQMVSTTPRRPVRRKATTEDAVTAAAVWGAGELATGNTAGWRRIAREHGLTESPAKRAAQRAKERHEQRQHLTAVGD